MCGIAGFFNPEMDFTKEKVYNLNILDAMNQAQKRRGPDDEGTFLNEHFGLAQVRLAIVDLLTGHQPMLHRSGSRTFGIVYNGELYNTKELRDELKTEGAAFDTDSDTEVLLNAYLAWGTDFISRVNGIFALAIMDTAKNQLLLYRDRSGIKPLFYTACEETGTVHFASEIGRAHV